MRWRRVAAVAAVGFVAVGATGCAKDLMVGTSSTATAVSDTGWIGGDISDANGDRVYIRHPDATLSTFGNANDEVLAINESGVAVGTNSVELSGITAWRWTPTGGKQALAGSGTFVAAVDINDSNVIVGSTISLFSGGPVYWASPTASPTALPKLSGASSASSAKSINKHGDIAGVMTVNGQQRAIWWDASEGYAIRELPGGAASVVIDLDISDNGDIAGTFRAADGSERALVWPANGAAAIVLQAPGAIRTTDITELGDVVGYVTVNGQTEAARWTAGNRTHVALGKLDGTSSQVNAADNSGIMVGTATAADGRNRATRFEG